MMYAHVLGGTSSASCSSVKTDTVNVVISDWLTMIIEFTAVGCWENLELFQRN